MPAGIADDAHPAPPPANVTVNLGALPGRRRANKPTGTIKAPWSDAEAQAHAGILGALVPMPRPKPQIALAEAPHKGKPP